MNISRSEQRILHVLALGGQIVHERDAGRKITGVTCFTHDGSVLAGCDMTLFTRLKRRRFIESRGGGPYRISRQGRLSVRAQLDNQG